MPVRLASILSTARGCKGQYVRSGAQNTGPCTRPFYAQQLGSAALTCAVGILLIIVNRLESVYA